MVECEVSKQSLWPLAFVVEGVPISGTSKSPKARQSWKDRISSAARSARPEPWSLMASEISVWITYFYIGDTELDVDNIAKLILDGLVDVIYIDDRIVSQVVVRKTQLRPGLTLQKVTPGLAIALEKEVDFVYIVVADPPDHSEIT